MKFLPSFFALVAVALAAAPAGRFVKAARMKPTDPWIAYPTRLVADLPGYERAVVRPRVFWDARSGTPASSASAAPSRRSLACALEARLSCQRRPNSDPLASGES